MKERSVRYLIRSAALVLVCALAGCVGPVASDSLRTVSPLRVSEVGDGGDSRRGASLWALNRGLDYASEGQSARALVEYERAVRVDASNPYAYVALTRHYLELGDAKRALLNLDQAELLLELDRERRTQRGSEEDGVTPRIQPHLDGLRGSAYLALGREAEARPLLDRARERAPEVWSDGTLTAGEFR